MSRNKKCYTLDQVLEILLEIKENSCGVSGETKVMIYNECYDENTSCTDVRCELEKGVWCTDVDNEVIIVIGDA